MTSVYRVRIPRHHNPVLVRRVLDDLMERERERVRTAQSQPVRTHTARTFRADSADRILPHEEGHDGGA